MSQRGIFDGESPPSTTTIFDPSMFDTLLAIPIGASPITVLMHGTEDIPVLFHGTEAIIVR